MINTEIKLRYPFTDQEKRHYIQQTIALIDQLLLESPRGLRSHLLPCDIPDLEEDKIKLQSMIQKQILENSNMLNAGSILEDASIIERQATELKENKAKLRKEYSKAVQLECGHTTQEISNRRITDEHEALSKTMDRLDVFMQAVRRPTTEAVEMELEDLERAKFNYKQALIRTEPIIA